MSKVNKELEGSKQRLPFIPKKLHTAFKAACAVKGLSMQEASEEAVRDWMNKDKGDVKNAPWHTP